MLDWKAANVESFLSLNLFNVKGWKSSTERERGERARPRGRGVKERDRVKEWKKEEWGLTSSSLSLILREDWLSNYLDSLLSLKIDRGGSWNEMVQPSLRGAKPWDPEGEEVQERDWKGKERGGSVLTYWLSLSERWRGEYYLFITKGLNGQTSHWVKEKDYTTIPFTWSKEKRKKKESNSWIT